MKHFIHYFKFDRSGCSGVGRVEIDTGINHGEQVSLLNVDY